MSPAHSPVCVIRVRAPDWGEGHGPCRALDTPEQREEATVSLGSGAWESVHNPVSCPSQPWISASTDSTLQRRACSQPGCIPHPDCLCAARLCPSWPSPPEDHAPISDKVLQYLTLSQHHPVPFAAARSRAPGLRNRPPLQPPGPAPFPGSVASLPRSPPDWSPCGGACLPRSTLHTAEPVSKAQPSSRSSLV